MKEESQIAIVQSQENPFRQVREREFSNLHQQENPLGVGIGGKKDSFVEVDLRGSPLIKLSSNKQYIKQNQYDDDESKVINDLRNVNKSDFDNIF